MSNLPSVIELACPQCRHKIKVKVGRNDPKRQSCPKCSALFDKKDLIAGFQKCNDDLAALEREAIKAGFKRVR